MMKTPIVLVSIGLLSSTLASMIGYSAWNSLRGQSNATPMIATAQSQPSLVSPIAPSYRSTAPVPTAPVPAATLPTATAATVAPPGAPPSSAWSQPENDYLFDLSQALQSQEYQRLNARQQLDIARQIQSWIAAGADFWSLRQQFDAAYRGAVVGDYAHNREVYIRFAAERFAPNHLAALMLPPNLPYENPGFDSPYAPPYAEPFLPYPDSYGYAPYPEAYGPDAYQYPMPYPGYPNPGYPNQMPAGPNDSPYPGGPYGGSPYGQPAPRQPQAPSPYSPPPQNSPNIPNLTEVST